MESKITKLSLLREQIGGCQSQGMRGGGMGEWGPEVQASCYNVSHEGVVCSMVTIVNNTVLHI